MTPAEQAQENIAKLKDALLSAHPQMPILLKTIHEQLHADPEVVTILTEEEIGVVVSGLYKQTGIEISSSANKTKGKSLKNLSIDDL